MARPMLGGPTCQSFSVKLFLTLSLLAHFESFNTFIEPASRSASEALIKLSKIFKGVTTRSSRVAASNFGDFFAVWTMSNFCASFRGGKREPLGLQFG